MDRRLPPKCGYGGQARAVLSPDVAVVKPRERLPRPLALLQALWVGGQVTRLLPVVVVEESDGVQRHQRRERTNDEPHVEQPEVVALLERDTDVLQGATTRASISASRGRRVRQVRRSPSDAFQGRHAPQSGRNAARPGPRAGSTYRASPTVGRGPGKGGSCVRRTSK